MHVMIRSASLRCADQRITAGVARWSASGCPAVPVFSGPSIAEVIGVRHHTVIG